MNQWLRAAQVGQACAMSSDQCRLVEGGTAPTSSAENLLAVHAMSNDQCQLVEREAAPKSLPENLLAVCATSNNQCRLVE